MSDPVLQLHDVEASYGAFRALFGVSLSVAEGQALAIVGPNGAGKTTVARVASGLVAPAKGSVSIAGEDMTGKATYKFARAGVAHATEGRSVFATLSVGENLELAFRRSKGRNGVAGALREAFDMFPVLAERRNQAAGTLSGGEQRMLSMAKVLVEAPKLLIADELSLGLAPVIVERTYELLKRLRDNGTALLVIEQHVSHALALCDEVIILDHGGIEWQGESKSAGDRVQAYLYAGTTG